VFYLRFKIICVSSTATATGTFKFRAIPMVNRYTDIDIPFNNTIFL